MKIQKRIFNYNIEDVIKSNIEMQTISRVLQTEFGFKNLNFNILINNSLKYYSSWTQEKKDKFIKTIGGKANFKKTKAYLENKMEIENEY
jgi:hypothetical protein